MNQKKEKEWGGIIVSVSCKNRCFFCGPTPLISNSEIRKMEIRVAKNIADFQEKNLKKIEISGADPIEYEHIIDLIKYLKKIGFEKVQLSTHGRRLFDDKFLAELVSSGIDILRVPIYGSNAEINDSITGSPGSFEETVGGLRKLSNAKHNIFIQLSTLIARQNKDDLPKMLDLVYSLKPNDFYIGIPCISNGDYSNYIPIKDLSRYVNPLIDYCKKKGYPVRFLEIPFCVFGREDAPTDNSGQPPDLGKYCQPFFKSEVKDLPSYRLKTKIEMCNSCRCYRKCDGFFVNDIKKYGTGNLKPIL